MEKWKKEKGENWNWPRKETAERAMNERMDEADELLRAIVGLLKLFDLWSYFLSSWWTTCIRAKKVKKQPRTV